MKRIEDKIKLALEAVTLYLLLAPASKKVPKEYAGYAASLGPSVINSGLLPALSFYTDIHKGEKENEVRRYDLLQAIHYILDKDGNHQQKNGLLNYVLQQLYPGFDLNKHVDKLPDSYDKQAYNFCKKEIEEASVAIKLALRNFEQFDLSKNKNHESKI